MQQLDSKYDRRFVGCMEFANKTYHRQAYLKRKSCPIPRTLSMYKSKNNCWSLT